VSEVHILPAEHWGQCFVPAEFIPAGRDEYYLRNVQTPKPGGNWRDLKAGEIEVLVKNGVIAQDWDQVLVTDPFNPHLVHNTEFVGLVRIGRLEGAVLEHHDLRQRTGITNSLVISCDVGDDCAVHNVRYLAHYLLGSQVMLLNIDEMHTSNHAKFGNGIVKDGEPEAVRILLDLINEAGGRAVMPFDGMRAADAYLWARYRDDASLQAKLAEITQAQFDSHRGYYGTVGDGCVVKNSRIIKDVKIGPACYIKGANKLKNLTINSSHEEPTQIGEGVELVNGIIGPGCHVFYGCKAVRFVMGNHASLKYGARLIHSYLGNNSTVSCCELLNSLIFPAHEQHHNNSFLVATLVMGQSNIAAGAPIGSNHNSRANDGEIVAGRGFWPGLCTTLKHSSRFASFVLLAKGSYSFELDIPLPFALVSDDRVHGRLQILPAYWWTHNLYALARNTWKFRARDKSKSRTQHVEFDYLGPDTVEEIRRGRRILEIATAEAHLRAEGTADVEPRGEEDLAALGRTLLEGGPEETAGLEVLGRHMENSARKVVLLKVRHGYHAYREMLHHYAVENLMGYLEACPEATVAEMVDALTAPPVREWTNLGGQIIPTRKVDELRADICSGRLDCWPAIHEAYDRLWARYPLQKQGHALAVLRDLLGRDTLSAETWQAVLDEALRIRRYMAEQVLTTRRKDYQSTFRRITYRNEAEMRAVLGTVEGNPFIRRTREMAVDFERRVATLRHRVESKLG